MVTETAGLFPPEEATLWPVGSPLRDEVYELGGESVGRQLRGLLVHHLLELLERSAPRVVGELQNGQLDLQQGKTRRLETLRISSARAKNKEAVFTIRHLKKGHFLNPEAPSCELCHCGRRADSPWWCRGSRCPTWHCSPSGSGPGWSARAERPPGGKERLKSAGWFLQALTLIVWHPLLAQGRNYNNLIRL